MTKLLTIHPLNPQARLINQAVEIVQQGGVIAYPTDSAYALGCQIGNKEAQMRIRAIRHLDEHHNFTLVCRDLSEISFYAQVDNSAFRFLKAYTPGPYTFILKATREVPRRLQNPKRKTIGIRVPDNIIAQELLSALNEPLMSSTLIMPGDEIPLMDPMDILDELEHRIDLIIDGGSCGHEMTTVIDLVDVAPKLIRKGKGEITLVH